jgi:transcriptional regulator with XRE-family HTH domain
MLVVKMRHGPQTALVNSLRIGLARATRELRTHLGLSQERLALAAGVHRSFVFRLEKGEVNVSLDVLCRLAAALGVSVSELIVLAEQRAG